MSWQKLWDEKVAPRLVEREGCLVFMGARTTQGYGVVRDHFGGSTYTHRLALYLQNGEWPKTTLHSCGNPECVRHIRAGTQRENMHELIKSGRHNLVNESWTPPAWQK